MFIGMVRGGFGHVINISSIWGKCAPSNRSAYSSAKFGIIGLMDAVRYEVNFCEPEGRGEWQSA